MSYSGFLSLTSICAIVWLCSDQIPLGDEIIQYTISCDGWRQKKECKGEIRAEPRETYKASVEQQTVLYWSEDDPVVKRYPRCAVRDSRNWSCEVVADGSPPNETSEFKHVMINGSSAYLTPFVTEPNFQNVPKWRWWRAKLFNS